MDFFSKKRKGFLFTVMTVLLVLALFLISSSFLEAQLALQDQSYLEGEKVKYVEDDVSSNFYSDVFGAGVPSSSRGTNWARLYFPTAAFLSPSISHSQLVSDYRNFFQGPYSQMLNANISLTGFQNKFFTLPFNSTFYVQQNVFKVSTIPFSTNYINSIMISVNASKARQGACSAPNNDPSSPSITVTLKDNAGFSCTNTVNLNYSQNNDQGGRQFYLRLLGGGSIEVKYGLVDSAIGTLKVIVLGANATVSDLYLNYSTVSLPQKFSLVGNSSIQISTQNIIRKSDTLLWEES